MLQSGRTEQVKQPANVCLGMCAASSKQALRSMLHVCCCYCWLQATVYLTPLIGAYLADAVMGRFWVILVFSFIYFLVSASSSSTSSDSSVLAVAAAVAAASRAAAYAIATSRSCCCGLVNFCCSACHPQLRTMLTNY
jgi:hypothetical protein